MNERKRKKARGPAPAAGDGSLRRRLILALSLIVAAAGTWAFLEFVLWNRLPPQLVGKWVVTKGPDEGGTIDFYRNGTMSARVNQGGFEAIINGAVRVDGKSIHVTTRHRQTGEQGVKVQTIKLLTANDLILQDDRGVSLHLERAE